VRDASESPTMPPVERLLALDTLTLWRVMLAMLGSAEWIRDDGTPGSRVDRPRWSLDGGRNGFAASWWDDGAEYTPTLPDPLSDPAAAWELMVREHLDVISPRVGSRTWTFYSGSERFGDHADPRRAVSLAALYKHASGPLEPLITPLLERINKEGLDK
jgi:hypothetical protein